ALGSFRVAGLGLGFVLQAEVGIRDWSVTGVQTCALPICASTELEEPIFMGDLSFFNIVEGLAAAKKPLVAVDEDSDDPVRLADEIGRASCRERAWNAVDGGVSTRKKKRKCSWLRIDVSSV